MISTSHKLIFYWHIFKKQLGNVLHLIRLIKWNISSKDCKSLETSQFARDTSKNQKQVCICHGNHCMGSGTLPEIILCEHSLPCHPRMQVKTLIKQSSHMWTWCRRRDGTACFLVVLQAVLWAFETFLAC